MLRQSGCQVSGADYCLDESATCAKVPDIRWAGGRDYETRRAGAAGGVDSLNEVLAKAAATVDVRLEHANAPLQIIYTSGTTGDPKGVVFPNSRFGLFAMLGMMLGYQPDDRPYTGLSLTHGNAQAVTLGPSLHMGLRAVFSRKFTKSRLWDITRRYGCTTFSMLGGMGTAIYSEPRRPNDGEIRRGD
jgi:crotonobetaine/carnitine-CoA ligase